MSENPFDSVIDAFARDIQKMMPMPDTNERKPLLSDEEMQRSEIRETIGGIGVRFPAREMKGGEVRDFYEAKITSGELMVVKYTTNDCGQCRVCGDVDMGQNQKYCHNCGAKIIE